MDDLADLELDAGQMETMSHAVVARVIDHLSTLTSQPAHGDLDGIAEMCRALREPPPEEGSSLDSLLAPLFDDWVHRSFNSAGPGYLAYVPGGGVFPAALGGFIADAVNRYTGVWNAAPVLVQLEANVLEWFRQWMGFPPGSRGLLTSGGSMATFSAIVSARHERLGTALRRGVLYTTTQAHHCVAKAAQLAGILPDRVRTIAVDERFAMRVDALADAVRADRQRGLVPFLVVSSAGTTNTGAVDPLPAIADLCAAESLWHHCDAAYGGFFNLCPDLQPTLAGMSRADSLALDPHKGLFLPYGTGALLVRDGDALRRAHEAMAGYLPPLPDAEFHNISQYGPELSRPFRGLPVWLALKLYGVARFRAALEEKRALAVACADALAAMDGITLVHPPPLSLFAFQLDGDPDKTAALMDHVNAKRRVMLTGCTIDGVYYGRVCVLCFRTRRQQIDHCIEDVASAVATLR